ncbi:serine hydrolase domain-containing protein [Tundrisphaera sp. TA3]|uniref:serine hydrolase domain-containing protein n=1 Tax=Tundrisphaera sp. TA3 TaxID=3435775 RepID=UPI003EC1562A
MNGFATQGRPRRAPRFAPDLDALEARRLMAATPAQVAAMAVATPVETPGQNDIGDTTGGGKPLAPVVPIAARTKARLTPRVVRELNAEIDRYVAENNLPSVAVGIWVPGSGRFLATRGTTSLESSRERTVADPFRIASITKTFTATAVLQLADRGKLRTSDPLSTWFPNFPNARNITVDDLLRMRSGLADGFDEAFLQEYYANPRIRVPVSQILARTAAKADRFKPPGEATVYNNTNYILLQEIVEKVSGRTLGQQIQRTILRPLGLRDTLYPTTDQLRSPLRGYSLDPATGRYIDRTVLNPAIAGGAGAMISTLGDLKTSARALATGTLLKRNTQQVRLDGAPISGAPSFVKYGQGIEELGRFVGHNGTIFGFSSEMYDLPALKATIVINVNRLDADDQSQSTPLFVALSKIAFPEYVNW